MSHARQQIRDAIIMQVTGLPTTGANVYQSRVRVFDTLPCLNVLTISEDLDADNSQMRGIQARELQIDIEVRIKSPLNLDDSLDTIAVEIESAIADDSTLGGLVKFIELQGTEIEFDDDLEQPVGQMTMRWLCLYLIDSGNPELIIS
ncbi:hypothetical protein HOD41_09335 [bacterium]|nr:hypothetical protein [bacterium]